MIELLRTRRSIRRFTPEPVAAAAREILEEVALRSPTSRNREAWEFVFVDDPALRRGLAGSKPHGGAFLADAPLAVVVCGDEGRSDIWIEDCAIACILLQVTAHGLGLGSCWAQIRGRRHADGGPAEDHIRRLLGLPETLRVEAVIAIGVPDEAPAPRPATDLARAHIHQNRWTPKPRPSS